MSFQEYSKYQKTGLDAKAYAARTQCLFTFGLIEAVMEIKVPETVLLNDDKTFMTGTRLRSLLRDWRNRIRALGTTTESEKWAGRVASALWDAHGLLQNEISHPYLLTRISSRAELANVFRAIACIAEAICTSRTVFPVNVRLRGQSFDWSFLCHLDDRWSRMMTDRGWCPYIVRSVDGCCARSYASTCQPARGDVLYVHNNCTAAQCGVNTVDTSTYRNKHVTSCGGCSALIPVVDDVLDLLAAGLVPVLRAQLDDSSLPPFAVASGTSVAYVAISHVWSDGLGSNTESGLPSCLVHRLDSLVRQVSQGCSFWIDSLCVPDREDMRKRAIGLMAQTYRNADIVLVIDSGIRTCSVHAPLEEKLLRVVTSGWMQRLWTLQEGILARKLMFEFLDGIVDVSTLIPTGEDLFDPLYMNLAQEVFRLCTYHMSPQSFSLSHVARALRWRTTSRAKDETLAISGFLGVDAAKLVDLSGEDRMKEFLLQLGRLPRNIVFTPCARLALDKFRWAPRTLLTKSSSALDFSTDQSTSAECTPDGLLAVYHVIYFDEVTMAADTLQWIVRHTKDNFTLKVDVIPSTRDEAGLQPSYAFNALLFAEFPGVGRIAYCLAVSVAPSAAQKDLFECQYVTRLFAARVSQFDRSVKCDVVVEARGYGRMKVLMI